MNTEGSLPVVEADALEIVLPGGDGVGPLTASIAPGEHVLVLGPSGSGKTTLLRTLAGAVPQHVRARVSGTLAIAGINPVTAGVAGVCAHAGTVAQDPVSGVCLPLVADEVALPLENRAVPREQIGSAVDGALAAAGALHLRERASGELSGGELQRVALAAATVAGPRLLLLDEPTSMLDAPGIASVRDAVAAVGSDVAVVLVEHRLDEWAAAGGSAALPARTVALGRSGRVLADGPTAQVLAEHGRELLRQGCWLPLDAELEALLGLGGGLGSPHVRGALLALARSSAGMTPPPPTAERGPVVLRARGLAVRAGGRAVLTGVDLDLHAGELVAIVGANGAGKSTLLAALAGLERPATGMVTGPRPGLVFQDPEHQLVGATVREEIAFGLPAGSPRVAEALARFDLADWATRSPYALSGGQKRRLSLAAMLVHDRPVLLADEPGYGLDRAATAVAMGALREAADGGLAVALTSHDLRAVAACADRVVVLAGGGVAAVLTPEELLRDPVALAAAGMVLPPLLAFLVEHDVPVRPALALLEGLAHDVAAAA